MTTGDGSGGVNGQSIEVQPKTIAIPTVVMCWTGDRIDEMDHGRYLVDRIPRARWIELPGDDFLLWTGDTDAIVDQVEEFLTGRRGGGEPSRTVATVMLTQRRRLDGAGPSDRRSGVGRSPRKAQCPSTR